MVRTLILLTTTFLVLFLSGGAFSQGCPAINIESPMRALELEVEEIFRARIAGSRDDLKFHWASTIGKVLNNYSGPEMRLVVPRKNNGYNATVFVRIDGLPAGCPNSASEIVGVKSLPIGEPLDKFELLNINKYDLMARIDNYNIALENSDSKAKGLIDMYFGVNESRPERLARIQKFMDAIRARKFDVRKVDFAFAEVKSRPGNTVFWIIPDGANRKWIMDDRPGAVFVDGRRVLQNPQSALPKRSCDCTWK